MQYMNNRIISFERRIAPTPIQTTLTTPYPPTNPQPTHPLNLMARPYYNFCEEHHDPSACQLLKMTKESILEKNLS